MQLSPKSLELSELDSTHVLISIIEYPFSFDESKINYSLSK